MSRIITKTKYFHVTLEKEEADTNSLISLIQKDGWVDDSLIVVNCSPDYSSRLSQTVNHRLSYLNGNELFEVVDMQMPYPNSSQVWSAQDKLYLPFDRYLKGWVQTNISPSNKYLFVDSGTIRGRNFNKVKLSVRPFLENAQFRFASLYKEKQSIFTPDYLVEEYEQSSQGGLLFQWENANNPNWDY